VGEKTTICAEVAEHVWPLVADGSIRPVVGRTLPLAEAAEAHRLMESGESTGKILLVA
jgi:NADPH:quinone reductase-like Zn-dependent oxidoreductase